MLFRVYFDLFYAPNQELLVTGSTIEEAVQRFMRLVPNANIIRVVFERELEVDE
jgi:hypothetical protein